MSKALDAIGNSFPSDAAVKCVTELLNASKSYRVHIGIEISQMFQEIFMMLVL
jgi:hypothetical protein